MKPMIKYRGGKSKEIDHLLPFFPTEFDTYFEPFFGGGALYFALEPKHAVINDVNSQLMAFYKNVKNDYDRLKQELTLLQDVYDQNQKNYNLQKKDHPFERIANENEDLYYRIRQEFNHPTGAFLPGTLYYFINKTAYSGMIRFNSKGEYNVPFGRYVNFNTNLITIDHHNLLNKTKIYEGDYQRVFNMAKENDFIFLDPPYDCIFNDYGNMNQVGGFTEKDQIRLANSFRNLHCKALMVVAKTPLTSKLYGDLIVGQYQKNYAVNIRNRFKNEAEHIVITNY